MPLWSVNELPIGSESPNKYRPTENPSCYRSARGGQICPRAKKKDSHSTKSSSSVLALDNRMAIDGN